MNFVSKKDGPDDLLSPFQPRLFSNPMKNKICQDRAYSYQSFLWVLVGFIVLFVGGVVCLFFLFVLCFVVVAFFFIGAYHHG